jgi:hypothetical protein
MLSKVTKPFKHNVVLQSYVAGSWKLFANHLNFYALCHIMPFHQQIIKQHPKRE